MGALRDFYVYEHWRSDTGLPFYVVKGRRNRAYQGVLRKGGGRNRQHRNVSKRLKLMGHGIEGRLVFTHLPEDRALELEVSTISYWRARGVNLVNQTEGGEGTSGYVFTAEQLAAQSAGVKAVWATLLPEEKAAWVEALKRTSNTVEGKARRSAAALECQNREDVKAARREITRRSMAQPTTKGKQRAALKLAFAKPEVKAKRSQSQKAVWATPAGKKKRSDVMRAMWASATPEQRVLRTKSQKEAQNRPEVRVKRSRSIKAAMARPEVKARQCCGLKAVGAAHGAKIKAYWDNPDWRASMLEKRKVSRERRESLLSANSEV